MKGVSFIVFLFLSSSLFAQRVKVTDVNVNYFRHAGVGGFYYLHDDLEENAYQWIADLKISFDSIYPQTISETYTKFKTKGNRMSANAFRVVQSDLYAKKKYIKIKIYYLKRERKDLNRSLFNVNKAYLFGFLGHHQNIQGYSVEINDERIFLEELRYKEIDIKEGDRLSIKIGKGSKKNAFKIEGKKEFRTYYLNFHLFKGMFTRGYIDEYDWSVGEFLKRILKREVCN